MQFLKSILSVKSASIDTGPTGLDNNDANIQIRLTTKTMSKPHQEEYGWTAVPRGRSNVPSEHDAKTTGVEVNFDSIWPQTAVVKQAQAYVKEKLPEETYNHSLRVYCYGMSC